jgi:hypothetical protein
MRFLFFSRKGKANVFFKLLTFSSHVNRKAAFLDNERRIDSIHDASGLGRVFDDEAFVNIV